MNTAVIGCRTIEKELTAAMEQTRLTYPIYWLEAGLHNVPQQLHQALQEQIDRCGDRERVLLAMGFCGNSVAGLRARGAELILPLADDCISLLCGSQEERLRYPETYFFTEGWLRGERTIWREYEYTLEKYGPQRGRRIFQAMLRNYRYCALLDTGCFDREAAGREVRRIAGELGLDYQVIPGTVSYLCQLLTGPWPADRFLTVPPRATLERNMLVL